MATGVFLPAAMSRQQNLLRVVEADNRVLVILPDGGRQPITRYAQPIPPFIDGWQPIFLYIGGGGLSILHLCNADGRVGSWFLDSRLDILPNDFDDLPIAYRAAATRSLDRDLEKLFLHVFAAIEADVADPAAFLYLHDQLIHHVLRRRLRDTDPDTIDIALSTLPDEDCTLQPTRNGDFITLPLQRLRALVGRDILDMAPDIIRDGRLAIASPADSVILTSDISICISNFVQLYRFVDESHDLPFLLIASTHVCKIVGLYFPLSNECFVMTAGEGLTLRSHCPHESIGRALREHLLQFGTLLIPYLRASSRAVRSLCWHLHLGHHLWQDLAGLDTLNRRLLSHEMPNVMMMAAQRSEMFGLLDMLFPALRGKVDRSCDNVVELIKAIYEQRLCLISPAGHYITRSLSQRILELAQDAEDLAIDRHLVARFHQLNLPIIILGLRVENRTVIDFPNFCIELLELIRDETNGRVVVVVDGHNASGTHVFESAGQSSTLGNTRTPLDIEKDIVLDLRKRFSTETMIVLDTVGAPMQSSIFWSGAADFFITPWGAGLAKYKWIANKPGLVLAGHLYQSRGFDLGIYQSPDFMEAPLPMTVIDIEDVEDVTDGSLVIPIQEPQRVNFRVNMEGVRRKLSTLLDSLTSTRAATLVPD